MTIDYKIIDEKLQYNIDRQAAKISTLSSEKVDKHEIKFTYCPLRKALEKQTKQLRTKALLNLMNLLKKILILTEIGYHLKNKK